MSKKDLWSPKGVSINLSAARRAALKAFAESSEPSAPLTPAQALYALIDLIGPASAAAADDEELQDHDAEAPLIAPSSSELSSELDERMKAIEIRLDAAIKAMRACSHAVEAVAQALTAVSAPSGVLEGNVDPWSASSEKSFAPDSAERSALSLKQWIQTRRALGGPTAVNLTPVALKLTSRATQPNGSAALCFSCERYPPARGGEREAALPDLRVVEIAGGALALLTALEPNARLLATFAAEGPRCVMSVGRLSAQRAAGAALYRCAA